MFNEYSDQMQFSSITHCNWNENILFEFVGMCLCKNKIFDDEKWYMKYLL